MHVVVHETGSAPRGAIEWQVAAGDGVTAGLSRFLRATTTPTLVADALTGRVLVANDAMADMLEVAAGDLVGRPAGCVLHDPEAAAAVTEAVRSDEHLVLERRLRVAGALRHGRVTSTPLRTDDGRRALAVLQVAETSELWAAIDRLSAERDAVEAANDRVAHDLKTPLTALVGMAELLTQAGLPDDVRAELAERIVANAHQAAQLAGRISTDTRPQGDEPLTLTRVRPLMSAVQSDMARPLAEAGATLSLQSEVDTVTVPSGLLRTVLTSLVASALHRRAPGRRLAIRVAVHQDDDQVRLEVADDGRALGATDAADVLRAAGEPTSGQGHRSVGTSRALLRDRGGDLWVEPNDATGGFGTCFVGILPVACAAGVELEDADRPTAEDRR